MLTLYNLTVLVSFLENGGHVTVGQRQERPHISFSSFSYRPRTHDQSFVQRVKKKQRVIFITDKARFAYAVNEQTTKDPKLLKLLRALVLICRRNNILFTALHIRGATENRTADSLSHLQMEEYKIPGSGYAPNVNPTANPNVNPTAGPLARVARIKSKIE